ncbi:MAG: DNA double-strand break repair nuclease NurA [Desulfurococcaceae archaeon]
MKYLSDIVDMLRKNITEGARITREDSSANLIELLDEAHPKQVDLVEKPFLKKLNVEPRKPAVDIFALDSSSRVIESSYLFMAIASGSLFSRFTGRAFDVPSVMSILGLEEPLCKHVVIVPEVEKFDNILKELATQPGVLHSNPLGVPYTSNYNKFAILNELRLSVEQCLLEEFSRSSLASNGTVLLVDGPLVYSTSISPEPAIPVHERKIYMKSIEHMNKSRVLTLMKLAKNGVVVISVVKRLHKSYILSSIDPAGISRGKMNDEAYLSTLLISEKNLQGEHVLLGPLVVKQKHEYGVDRLIWYIGVSRRIYPLRGGFGNYVFYRVEVFNDMYTENVLGYVVYDSIYTGSVIPLSILVVDKRVKKLSGSIANYVLYLTGLTQEATMQYISVF